MWVGQGRIPEEVRGQVENTELAEDKREGAQREGRQQPAGRARSGARLAWGCLQLCNSPSSSGNRELPQSPRR